MSEQRSNSGPDPTDGVYGISVAAGMVGTGVQNLRAYERAGLLEPSRTLGGTRLYSQNDVDRLRHIDDLLRAGLNLAGIAMVLALEADLEALRTETERLRARLRTSEPQGKGGPPLV
ncbi:MAG: MerR family transcriptional regulator [Actinomycetes bacterium]